MHRRTRRLVQGGLLLLGPVLFAAEQDWISTKAVAAEVLPVSWEPMLAEDWQEGMVVEGWWVSEKLDGIRALWTGHELLTRRGNRIHAPEWFIAGLPQWPLDGELWMGRGQFARTLSVVRDQTPGPEWAEVQFGVFDAPAVEGEWEHRLAFLQQWQPPPHVQVLAQEPIRQSTEVPQRLQEIVQAGGEGLVLRRPGSLYESGRSSDWRKVKRFQEGDAVVLRHLPGKGRHAGRLGSLEVQTPEGKVFRLGTGFRDDERDDPPPVGSTVQFRHTGFTKNGIPRFAVFLRVRDDF